MGPLIHAWLAIRKEAYAIEEGRMDRNNNPLKNAPHTMEDLVGEWDRPYSREAACFQAGASGSTSIGPQSTVSTMSLEIEISYVPDMYVKAAE